MASGCSEPSRREILRAIRLGDVLGVLIPGCTTRARQFPRITRTGSSKTHGPQFRPAEDSLPVRTSSPSRSVLKKGSLWQPLRAWGATEQKTDIRPPQKIPGAARRPPIGELFLDLVGFLAIRTCRSERRTAEQKMRLRPLTKGRRCYSSSSGIRAASFSNIFSVWRRARLQSLISSRRSWASS